MINVTFFYQLFKKIQSMTNKKLYEFSLIITRQVLIMTKFSIFSLHLFIANTSTDWF